MFKSEIKKELKKISQELGGSAEMRFNVEKPVFEKFGDLSTNLALVLAKELKMSPIEIAKKISLSFPTLTFLERVEIEQPGFVNFYIKKEALLLVTKEILQKKERFGSSEIFNGQKIVLEHTNVNPNKALHIGHLRSTCLGSSVENILRFLGAKPEVHYYVDDTGVQVSITGLGFKELEGSKTTEEKEEKFDHLAGKIYSQTVKDLEDNSKLLAKQKEIIRILDSQEEGETLNFFQELTKKILKSNLETTTSLEVNYDLLVWESDILKNGFFKKALEIMKENPNFYFAKKGKNKGCLVMKDESENEKVLVKSSGEATYTGKDIAYHLWKFNLLGADFKYKKWEEKSSLFTTAKDGKSSDKFGKADLVINFIDNRQSFPQEMVRLALSHLGFKKEAENMIHVGYGVVSLSPKTAKALGKEISETKNQYAMSGREGIFVLADDLLDLVKKEVWKKHPDSPANTEIAIGALKYTMLNYNPFSDIVFSYDKALDIQGNSGPYLQYTFARCQSILEKAKKIKKEAEFNQKYAEIHLNDEERAILRSLFLFPQKVRRAGEKHSPNLLTNFLFDLASRFNSFYAKHHVLQKGQAPMVSEFRLLLVASTAQVLENGLKLLGIKPIKKM